jgi:hypothetical protein
VNTINFNAEDLERPSWVMSMMGLFPKAFLLILVTAVNLPLWPLYWLGCLILNRPPNVPRAAQAVRYLKLTWTVRPPYPGLSIFARIGLTMSIIQKVLGMPIVGLAWLIDEILYGKRLNGIQITAPIFVISAGRSGSTQMTRYLEDDPRLAAPNILQCMFPYLWLWRLIPRTLGRLVTPEKVRKMIQGTMPPELWERHEADPFRADTFDGSFYSFHMNHLALSLGPEVAVEDFTFAKLAPYDQKLKEEVFIEFVDRIARKTLLNAGPAADGTPWRFFLKGHFLYAAQALNDHYPDARFLTIIREPLSRIRSGVNYLRVNPADSVLGPVPWAWLGATLEITEADYCEIEQDWFTQQGHNHRYVIRFVDYVDYLEGTMKKVYSCCFDSDDLPPHVPIIHTERERQNYSINRTLAEVGIDESKMRERLAEYISWCQGSEE